MKAMKGRVLLMTPVGTAAGAVSAKQTSMALHRAGAKERSPAHAAEPAMKGELGWMSFEPSTPARWCGSHIPKNWTRTAAAQGIGKQTILTVRIAKP